MCKACDFKLIEMLEERCDFFWQHGNRWANLGDTTRANRYFERADRIAERIAKLRSDTGR